jgi:hypothetical protein
MITIPGNVRVWLATGHSDRSSARNLELVRDLSLQQPLAVLREYRRHQEKSPIIAGFPLTPRPG